MTGQYYIPSQIIFHTLLFDLVSPPSKVLTPKQPAFNLTLSDQMRQKGV